MHPGPRTIGVHDLCGFAFPLQLSRELARRGHRVEHLYSASFVNGKGDVAVPAELADRLRIRSLDDGRAFVKYSMPRRVATELRYGGSLVRRFRALRPDVVLTADDPPVAKALLTAWVRWSRTPWVLWQQDLLHLAVEHLAVEHPARLRRLAAAVVRTGERAAARAATHVVCISPGFVDELVAIGVPREKCTVIPNWAPIDHIAPLPRENAWKVRHGLDGRRVVLYAGTLGLKHDPALLLDVARRLRALPGTVLVVVSEGLGADHLAAAKAAEGLDTLELLPFQPYEDLPLVLAAADVALAVLDESADAVSVPSKVLSHLASGRPIVASIPSGNLAAEVVVDSGAGMVADPADPQAFVDAVVGLLTGPAETRERLGANGRAHAEAHFGIDRITDRFLALLLPDREATCD